MNIIHLSVTPLAGAPIRLVKALNKYTDLNCNLIVFEPDAYGSRTFPNDLIWENDKDSCIELIQKADILHFHHAIHDVQKFIPELDLETECNAKILRQHHSAPFDLLCKHSQRPEIVIPHYAERYFPNARIVPNIIDENMLAPYIDTQSKSEFDFVFAPSNIDTFAYDARWSTKAAPETIQILTKNDALKVAIVHDMPFSHTIKMKSKAKIVIDDTVTGSIHQGALEAACMGKATICHLDARMRYVFKKVTGAKKLPFILSSLESLKETITLYHNASDEKIATIGRETQEWMREFYSPEKTVNFYLSCYKDLIVSNEYFIAQSKKDRRKYNNAYGLFLIYYSGLFWLIRKLIYKLKRCIYRSRP